jgi:hypothetical protein
MISWKNKLRDRIDEVDRHYKMYKVVPRIDSLVSKRLSISRRVLSAGDPFACKKEVDALRNIY